MVTARLLHVCSKKLFTHRIRSLLNYNNHHPHKEEVGLGASGFVSLFVSPEATGYSCLCLMGIHDYSYCIPHSTVRL